MNILALLSADQKEALCQTIQTACSIFWGPVDSFCETMRQKGVFNEILQLESFVAKTSLNDLSRMNRIIRRFETTKALFSYLESTYVGLFISNRKGVLTPLYHSCHEFEGAPMMGPAAITMKRKLAAVGLKMDVDFNEPPDHLSVELEYLYFLLSKGWAENNESYTLEAISFAADFMLPWTLKFYNRLQTAKDAEFYLSALSLAVAGLRIIGDDGERYGGLIE
ncbi:molecular chaperone [Thermodesulfobacteriota bacterium]